MDPALYIEEGWGRGVPPSRWNSTDRHLEERMNFLFKNSKAGLTVALLVSFALTATHPASVGSSVHGAPGPMAAASAARLPRTRW